VGDVRERGTVLVVEDSDDVLETVEDGLRVRGYRVLAAHDGLKALTMLASIPVDAIVLDLNMPVMSGWEFLDARSADPWLAAIPVVILSGVDAAPDASWCALVAKPFAIEQLVSAIERCRGRAPRRDTRSQLPRL
jgi:CheY-like chemotaxis protein